MERANWRRIFLFLKEARELSKRGAQPDTAYLPDFESRLKASMDENFNTSEALAKIHAVIRDSRKTGDPRKIVACEKKVRAAGEAMFGLFQNVESLLDSEELRETSLRKTIDEAIRARAEARKNKDYTAADTIRAKLLNDRGVELVDLIDGSTIGRMKA
jgi:cysteinyl-tRNA synthetase